MRKEEYLRYLNSPEWFARRAKVKLRAGGLYERHSEAYRKAKIPLRPPRGTQTHHLTYARIGHERLSDLQFSCAPCHEYISGVRRKDPIQIRRSWWKTLMRALINL